MTEADHSVVPIRDYTDAVVSGLRWWVVTAALGFAAIIITIDKKNDAAVKLALDGMREATKVALDAADAKGVQHNGLIEYLRQLMGKFITREALVAFVVALGVFTSVYVAFLK